VVEIKKQKINKKFKIIMPLVCGIFFLSFFAFVAQADERDFNSGQKQVEFDDGGTIFEINTDAATVEDFLKQQKIQIKEADKVFPEKSAKIFSGAKIYLQRAKKINIKEGGNTIAAVAYGGTIEQAIWQNKNIELDEDDITTPARNLPVVDGMNVQITHVLIKEEVQNQDIAFKTISNEDDKLGWRIKKVTQPGEKGAREVKYKAVYNNGKEISRKILESNVTKDPVNEVVTQGTLVKVGKVHTGAASWYAYTGTLSAANPWLPMGSYVRVTNQDNGKSVIVKINDRGPFGNGRIIDLDKVAFAQIANLGQGTANIKMEVITN
jgi:uncharacterized protein YabE (DUF348 family)